MYDGRIAVLSAESYAVHLLNLAAALLPAAFAQSSNYVREGDVAPLTSADCAAGQTQSLLYSLNPGGPFADSRVTVSVVEGDRVLVEKTLHAGDPDLYAIFRPGEVG